MRGILGIWVAVARSDADLGLSRGHVLPLYGGEGWPIDQGRFAWGGIMVFYFGRRFDAARVDVRLRAVRCDRCEGEYFYELARLGSGGETAPYGIGSARAERAAAEQARRDLGQRLEREAELVPCPKCHWINDELVAGYRRGCYRGWGKAAVGVAIVGTAISMIAAWFLSIGPAVDRGAVPYALIGGPAISIALAGAFLGIRHWLRGLIRPNRDFPFPPRLPRGCPPPLVLDPQTGELEAVDVGTPADSEWVDFQVGRHGFPSACCECLRPAEPGSACRLTILQSVVIEVPHCSSCARRGRKRRWRIGLIGWAATMAAGSLGLWSIPGMDEVLFWICFIGLALIAPCVGATIAHGRAAPFWAKVADASRGVFRLRFRNPAYRQYLASAAGASRPEGA